MGRSEEDVKARIAAAWKKWHDLTGFSGCLLYLKIYRTTIRPVLIYGADRSMDFEKKTAELLERTEMRMLCWILGVKGHFHYLRCAAIVSDSER